jgi:phage terminase Nu1 subunit (DNA packaging protein)
LALTLAQLESVELKNKKTSSELIPRVDILPGWSRVTGAARSAMVQIPERAKIAIPKLTKSDLKILAKMIRDGLTHAGIGPEPPQYGPETAFDDEGEGV